MVEPMLGKCQMALTDCVVGTNYIDRTPIEAGHSDHDQQILTHPTRPYPSDRVYEQHEHRQSVCAYR
mgnify:CR=1 FL=1